jgi:2-polyprenyl-6-methoxyphenol hydroxylase-like FAD-dependent oxidoreductase
MPRFDVLTPGGGPAGAAITRGPVRRGASVAVLERSRYDGERVGEILPPSAAPLLPRLGVWNLFEEAAHFPLPGIVSSWAEMMADSAQRRR